nr:MAG TPA: SWI/SNF-RELATED MATRIX-ASSOCIATED ACTIN-DEPENDENT REGULATOR OF PROTEIN [Caudoviricetes sp.]DAV19361.1 MAG TPA: SWI/SNF-RELATED MATRIX-ASSOCIATED ACTIN-DEPENDENT REGULATOR OF PROTEIN [Caudoviricetes sp.]
MDQVSAYMGVPKRDVCKRYPDGWNNNGAGDGRGKRIRLDTLLDQEYGVY